MYLKKTILKGLILSLFTVLIVGCSDDDNNAPVRWSPPADITKGAFVLNSGGYGENNATLAFYNSLTNSSDGTVFESMNDGLFLGDTGQDILISENVMYIAMYGSAAIYVTTTHGQLLKEITSVREGETQAQQPRALAASGNYIYVTYFDGYLARINKNTYAIEGMVKVGVNPEGLVIANGKIYVANSGGLNFPIYDKTVSVIDINTFTELKKIEVTINPNILKADKNGNVYLISMGNYGNIPNTLQRIDATTDAVEVIGNATLMEMNAASDKLYLVYAQSMSNDISYTIYNTTTKQVEEGSFVDSGVSFSANPYAMNIDPLSGEIYMSVTDYTKISDVYIVSPVTGKLVGKFKSGGLNPVKVAFVR